MYNCALAMGSLVALLGQLKVSKYARLWTLKQVRIPTPGSPMLELADQYLLDQIACLTGVKVRYLELKLQIKSLQVETMKHYQNHIK